MNDYTTSDYLEQLQQDREDLVDNLEAQGISDLVGDETFTELVPRVLEIEGGDNKIKYTVSSETPITLPNATNEALNQAKIYGICTQNGTPTPTVPVDIECNNGAIKIKDDELPIGYKRLKDIIFDGGVYYVTDTYLTGADTTSFTINATENARNVLGCYTGSSSGNNVSFYLATGGYGNYVRYKGGLYRPIINSIGQDYTLSITPTGTIGFDTNATWTKLEFTCPDKLYIGWLANATSPKFLGKFKGNITVSNRAKFIPCERQSDNEIGYYDLNSNTFFENQGAGTPTTSGYDSTHNIIYIDGTNEVLTMGQQTANVETLLSVGNYKDEQDLISGDIVRNCEAVYYDGTQTINTPYLSTTGGLNVGSIIVHPKTTPTTETTTAQTLTAQQGTNTISSNKGAREMEIKYYATKVLQSKSTTITTNVITTITPDFGYYGLSNVNITTNVPSQTQYTLTLDFNGAFNEELEEYKEIELNENTVFPLGDITNADWEMPEEGVVFAGWTTVRDDESTLITSVEMQSDTTVYMLFKEA